jgi:hypothetical protein
MCIILGNPGFRKFREPLDNRKDGLAKQPANVRRRVSYSAGVTQLCGALRPLALPLSAQGKTLFVRLSMRRRMVTSLGARRVGLAKWQRSILVLGLNLGPVRRQSQLSFAVSVSSSKQIP